MYIPAWSGILFLIEMIRINPMRLKKLSNIKLCRNIIQMAVYASPSETTYIYLIHTYSPVLAFSSQKCQFSRNPYPIYALIFLTLICHRGFRHSYFCASANDSNKTIISEDNDTDRADLDSNGDYVLLSLILRHAFRL